MRSPESAILAVVRAIPRGQVLSYGEVARRAGLPRRARLVARVLSGSDEADLPWHRVVRADRRIAFPDGSRGFLEQCRRLRNEGVKVEKGRVQGAARSTVDLDQLLWRPS